MLPTSFALTSIGSPHWRARRPASGWCAPPSPASTASARSTPCSPTRRSTRCSSTPTATSGSSATASCTERATSPRPTSPSSSSGSWRRSADDSTAPRPSSTPGFRTGLACCAVVPPVATDGACLSVRRFRDRSRPLESFGSDAVTELVGRLVDRRCNVVVGGATSAGKTSLLNAALGRVPPGERIVTIEDTAELLPATVHLLRLEARPPTVDGPPPITLEHLVRTALRLRPDRLVVGEVRGPEVLALVQALNTGHDGSWSTCHANSALDVLHRLETLVDPSGARPGRCRPCASS